MKPKYWTIIILAAVTVAVSLMYFVRAKQYDLGSIVTFHRKVKNSQQPATTTPQIDLKGWEMYQDNQNNFELLYPPDLNSSDLNVNYASPEQIGLRELTVCDAYPEKKECQEEYHNSEIYQIAGKSVRIYWVLYGGEQVSSVGISTESGGEVDISLKNGAQRKELFKQILSTFKFIK